MSTPYLFDNAVLDRNARLANGMPVESALEFAEALHLLARFPDRGIAADDELLDTFLDRKHVLASHAGERGGIHAGVAFLVVLVAGALWGWTHSSASPNGATLTFVLVLAAVIGIPTVFLRWWYRVDHEAAAYTAEQEGRMQADTTGDHIWDA